MREILTLIEKRQQEFAQLPLFDFMQDKSIDPRERLSWAPCAASFVLNFGELNKYCFREEPTNDPIQAIVNKHTYEDENHWLWFLEDLEKLQLDKTQKFSDALRFLWSEQTKNTRALNYQLYGYTHKATPIQKLLIIEVIEATGSIMFYHAAKIAREIKAITKKECRYFADFHLVVETEHMLHLSTTKHFIEKIQLSEEIRQEAFELVEKLFECFGNFFNELLYYAKSQKIYQQKYSLSLV
ncbi:hypothetical protein JYQ62_03190 [Nostoc sp. UHCC 0702]|nr:hypothetical protein JYQ62_03190 [Nostoc sp. UHCC 0702]